MVGIRKWLGPGTVGISLFSEPECLTRKDESLYIVDTWGTGGGVGGGGGLLQEGAGLPHHMKNQKCGACDENHVVNSHCRYNLIGFLLN